MSAAGARRGVGPTTGSGPPGARDELLRAVHRRLKYLACVQRGDRLDTRYARIVRPMSLDALCRWLRGSESRDDAVAFVDRAVSDALALLHELAEATAPAAHGLRAGAVSGAAQLEYLVHDLCDAAAGIANLQHSYPHDTMFGACMRDVLHTVRMHVDGLGVAAWADALAVRLSVSAASDAGPPVRAPPADTPPDAPSPPDP